MSEDKTTSEFFKNFCWIEEDCGILLEFFKEFQLEKHPILMNDSLESREKPNLPRISSLHFEVFDLCLNQSVKKWGICCVNFVFSRFLVPMWIPNISFYQFVPSFSESNGFRAIMWFLICKKFKQNIFSDFFAKFKSLRLIQSIQILIICQMTLSGQFVVWILEF